MDLETLMASIRGRDPLSSRWGVGCADSYLKQIESAVREGMSEEQWNAALQRAASTLTYCHPDLEIIGTDGADADDHVSVSFGNKLVSIIDTKRTKDDVPEGTIMVFDAIITTPRKDRDDDILESKGADPDLAMPLLWQHNHTQPIGKLVRILAQNSKRVSGRFAVADTPLGRDAVTLIEFGALRISHGFLPKQWEEIDPDEWGYRFTEFEIMETSVVSVPSNRDAVITAYSGDKLCSPQMQKWAKGVADARPTQVRGTGVEPPTGVIVPEEPPVIAQPVKLAPIDFDPEKVAIEYIRGCDDVNQLEIIAAALQSKQAEFERERWANRALSILG